MRAGGNESVPKEQIVRFAHATTEIDS